MPERRSTSGCFVLVPFSMPTPATTLRSSLEKHNETFEHLLQLIPAQYYVLDDKHDEQVKFELEL